MNDDVKIEVMCEITFLRILIGDDLSRRNGVLEKICLVRRIAGHHLRNTCLEF